MSKKGGGGTKKQSLSSEEKSKSSVCGDDERLAATKEAHEETSDNIKQETRSNEAESLSMELSLVSKIPPLSTTGKSTSSGQTQIASRLQDELSQQSSHTTSHETILPKKDEASTFQAATNLRSVDDSTPRQVIAVSASKGPAAFFNLARKFLVEDELCDLSALEGAIVSAVDAAHLLERSKLATIVRIRTSFVVVEPKRQRQPQQHPSIDRHGRVIPSHTHSSHQSLRQQQSPPPILPAFSSSRGNASGGVTTVLQQPPPPPPIGPRPRQSQPVPPSKQTHHSSRRGGELRRARIVITVRRTREYEVWLRETPPGEQDDNTVAVTESDET